MTQECLTVKLRLHHLSNGAVSYTPVVYQGDMIVQVWINAYADKKEALRVGRWLADHPRKREVLK